MFLWRICCEVKIRRLNGLSLSNHQIIEVKTKFYWPLGSVFNALTVVLGTIIGTLAESVIEPEAKLLIFQGIGLVSVALGIKMLKDLNLKYFISFFVAVLLGGFIGHSLGLSTFLSGWNHKKASCWLSSSFVWVH